MNFSQRLNIKIFNESKHNCIMFWCIPVPLNDSYKWDIISFNSKGDDLSNWLIVLFQLKMVWKKNFEQLKDMFNCLPRGIVYNNYLYHGNNLPINLFDISKKINVNLGDECQAAYDNKYGISSKGLQTINNIIGLELDLPTTDI